MKTLFQETVEVLAACKKTGEDVRWVGSADGKMSITWEEFELLSREIEYSPYVYESPQVVWDLVVVGDGWWLKRTGEEFTDRWLLITVPNKDCSSIKFCKMVGCWWVTLEEINGLKTP